MVLVLDRKGERQLNIPGYRDIQREREREREIYYTDWVGSCVRGITYLKAIKYMSLYENQNGHGEKCLAQ